jgi:hypothetical protein
MARRGAGQARLSAGVMNDVREPVLVSRQLLRAIEIVAGGQCVPLKQLEPNILSSEIGP